MIEGDIRREKIIEIMSNQKEPVSSSDLAKKFGVSRQVIVQDELYTIVDYGGKVLDAVVEHDIYGQITVDLMLCNRMDVDEFMERIRKSKSQPLNVLTGGKHWHTVEADTELMLQVIGEKLREKGYLQE